MPTDGPGRGRGRRDEVARRRQVKGRHGELVDHRRPPPATARARSILAEQLLDQFFRRRVGQGFALIRPFLELDEAPRGVAVGIEAARIRRIAARCARDRATRMRPAALPSAARPRFAAAPFACRHMSWSACARAFGIMREIPRRSQSDEALARRRYWPPRSPSFRRGNSRSAPPARQCCAARAAAIPRHGRRR